MPQLTIVRGIAGTGKTTVALAILAQHPDWIHLEVDQWFTDDKGVYNFVLSELGHACGLCSEAAEAAMNEGKSVIVSNPFTRPWEMEIYFIIAEGKGYDIVVIDCLTEYPNIHGIQPELITSQRERWVDGEQLVLDHPTIKLIENPNK